MTSPSGPSDAFTPIASAVLDGVGAIQDNASRLGLTWKLRPGTVLNSTALGSVLVTLDGDVGPVNCTSFIGPLAPGTRVMAEIVPPSGVYLVGYAGQQTINKSRLYSDRATTTIFNATTYANLTDALIVGFQKAVSYTKLRVDLRVSGFASSALAIFAVQGGVNIQGVDYDVNWFFFNQINVHASWSAVIDLEDIPAGTFDVQARFRVDTAARACTIDVNDYVTLEVTEIV